MPFALVASRNLGTVTNAWRFRCRFSGPWTNASALCGFASSAAPKGFIQGLDGLTLPRVDYSATLARRSGATDRVHVHTTVV